INDRYITCNIDSYITFFFFLTSRRLHTRSKRDWSSDVCSSDLLDLPGGVGIEGRPQREREGGDAEGLLPQIDRGVRGPSPQLEQDGFELGTPCGELVDRGRSGWAESPFVHDARLGELFEATAQDVRADPRQGLAQIRVAPRTEQQLPDDRQGPALADQIKSPGDPAGIAIGAHACTLQSFTCKEQVSLSGRIPAMAGPVRPGPRSGGRPIGRQGDDR